MKAKRLIIASLFMVVCGERTVRDGKAKCMDFAGLKKDLVTSIGTRSKSTPNTVFSLPGQIEIAIMKRDVWNAYCYHGSAIDPNTGCDPIGTTVLLPDTAEAESWFKKEKCKIGDICENWADECMGDGARKCLNNELTRWVNSASGGYNSWWKKFPYHTCSKRWNCEIKKSTITPVLIESSGIRVEINILDEWYPVYSKGKFTKYFKSDRNKLVVYVPEFKVSLETGEIKCIETYNTTECVVMNSITGMREIIEIGSTEWSVGKTAAVKNAKKLDTPGSITKQREEFTRAASINDLKRTILATHYTQAEVDNNFDMVNMNFMKVTNILMGILEYNTKKDDKAFSVIMGGNKIMKWITPDIVRVCKTHHGFWKKNYGCVNGSHYAGGTYHSTKRYKCNKPKKVSAPYNLEMNLEKMGNLTSYDIDAIGTTSSERINRELNEERIREIEAKLLEQSVQSSGGRGSNNSFLDYLNPSRLFSILSDYLVYVNSALIVLLFLKR